MLFFPWKTKKKRLRASRFARLIMIHVTDSRCTAGHIFRARKRCTRIRSVLSLLSYLWCAELSVDCRHSRSDLLSEASAIADEDMESVCFWPMSALISARQQPFRRRGLHAYDTACCGVVRCALCVVQDPGISSTKKKDCVRPPVYAWSPKVEIEG